MRSTYPQPTGGQPTIVCLHSSASSSRQWHRLRDEWDALHVVAPDLIGYGNKSWSATTHSMADEVQAVSRVIADLGRPVHLVGHSYGGAVATLVAIENPGYVRSLVLFEPVLFPLLYAAAQQSGKEIWVLQTGIRRHVQNHRYHDAAEQFVDYWNVAGAYRAMPEHARESIAAMMPKVAAEFAALISNPIAEADLQAVSVPTLVLYGAESPRSTRDIARRLAVLMPDIRTFCFEGLGHMGPLTAPEQVNAEIAAFVAGTSDGWVQVPKDGGRRLSGAETVSDS